MDNKEAIFKELVQSYMVKFWYGEVTERETLNILKNKKLEKEIMDKLILNISHSYNNAHSIENKTFVNNIVKFASKTTYVKKVEIFNCLLNSIFLESKTEKNMLSFLDYLNVFACNGIQKNKIKNDVVLTRFLGLCWDNDFLNIIEKYKKQFDNKLFERTFDSIYIYYQVRHGGGSYYVKCKNKIGDFLIYKFTEKNYDFCVRNNILPSSLEINNIYEIISKQIKKEELVNKDEKFACLEKNVKLLQYKILQDKIEDITPMVKNKSRKI